MFNNSGESFGSETPREPNLYIPEATRILQGLLTELPEQAQELVDKVDRELARIQEKMDEDVAHLREMAERKVAEVEGKAEQRRKAILQHTLEQLEPLQKDLFRAGELGKALATFVMMQTLKARSLHVMPDPGNLLQFQQVGKSFHFQVTGSNQGPVWGTDVYTSDSHLATAAVHAGALEAGEEGVVHVSVVNMAGMEIVGTVRHGVMTMNWGPYPVGYRVGRA
jgi:LCCL domain